jgi:hypothetical protein
MANKKMTIKQMFEAIAENPTLTAEQKAFLLERAEKSVKKSNGERKPTKTQEANKGLRVEILESMEEGRKYTISDMIKEFKCCEGLSSQKVSALIRQMVTDNLIQRVEEKRRAYFVKGEVAVEEEVDE